MESTAQAATAAPKGSGQFLAGESPKPDYRSGLPLAAALPKGLDPEPFWPLPRRRCRMSGSQVAGHRKD